MSEPGSDETPPETTSQTSHIEDVVQSPVSHSQHPAKPYSPPKPDSLTFPTPKAFLDSLQPIPIEQVEDNNQRCPICWKLYGEVSDPGFDNTEMPVRLRCGHVYGDKCLASTFRAPETRYHRLRPLSFSSCSRKGCVLGQKMHEFLSSQDAIDGFRDIGTMLKHACDVEVDRGHQLFGEYWSPILQEVAHNRNKLTDIILMENALILDYDTKARHTHPLNEYSQSTWALLANMEDFDEPLPPITATASLLGHEVQLPAEVDPSDLFINEPTPPSTGSNLELPPMPAYFQPTPNLIAVSAAQSSSDATQTWQEKLAHTTNLDKLSALHKGKQKEKSNESKIAEDKKAYAEKLKAWEQQKAAVQLQREQAHAAYELKMRQEQEILKRANMALLASKLVGIYNEYIKHREEVRDISQDSFSRSYYASVIVHLTRTQELSIQIEAPPVERHSNDDEDGTEFDLSKTTVVLKRSNCQRCNPAEKRLVAATQPIPTEIWWRTRPKGPDDCPLCHKVLYIRETPFHSTDCSA
ncbi:hypothetical protein CC86DRAFT_469053 [Ophiobolus disseminans]|uniref:RING-type domain-containing protein n=1 Tax=Ophiobolus disseminans TaxID=1469910 RepID=A0A6A6ZRW9_9PLEO|nr:hypothetical protein CC86DRAFT_469053 [Ophiobolus disseminans]